MVTAFREARGNRREAKGKTRTRRPAKAVEAPKPGSGLAERTYDNMRPVGSEPADDHARPGQGDACPGGRTAAVDRRRFTAGAHHPAPRTRDRHCPRGRPHIGCPPRVRRNPDPHIPWSI